MTAFTIAAALLALATLAIMLRPLAFSGAALRDKPQRRTLVALGLLVPLVAGGLYLLLGNRAALDPHAAGVDAQMEQMVTKLAARLKSDPSDTKGWVMLARSYKVMGRTSEAELAYDRAATAIEGDAQELASYADVVASNAGGHFPAKAVGLLEKALHADPQNPMALWLTGAAALEAGDAGRAVGVWKKLLALLPPESDDARELRAQIVQAGGTVAEPAAPAAAAAPGAATSAVSGRVEIAPGLGAAPDDVVFIIARAPDQRMPAAVIRTTVAQLPREFRLDDSLAMSPQSRISGLREVLVEARVSKSGQPSAQPGDLVAETQKVGVGASGLVLKIARVAK
jgi:cytochrome c-type biogenesis protein CcmH